MSTVIAISVGSTHGVMSDMVGMALTASPLAVASLCLSSGGGELAPSHCDCSSGESHIESIMCNKLLRKSSYFTQFHFIFVSKFMFSSREPTVAHDGFKANETRDVIYYLNCLNRYYGHRTSNHSTNGIYEMN